MRKQVLLLMCLVGAVSGSYARDKHPATGTAPEAPVKGIDFIENKGQWLEEAKFKAEIPGGVMFLTSNGFVYNFVDEHAFGHASTEACTHGEFHGTYKGHAYKVNFKGAKPNPKLSTAEKRSYYHNYFIGNDATKWAGKVGLFGTVQYKDLYEGTDLVVYNSDNHSVKYDLVVKAGADPAKINMVFEGVQPRLNEQGNLVIKTTVNEIVEQAPYTYQVIGDRKVEVPSRYVFKGGQLSFEFPQGYDKAHDLIIDPVLVFAAFSGGSTSAFYAHSTTFDDLGNTYSAALGYGVGWPTTIGAYQTTYPNSQTASIVKANATGSNIIYATYFGGTGAGNVQPNTLRVNEAGELFMAGNVSNANMPVTPNAYQLNMSGGSDIYITHFSEDGSSLIGSTFLGGTGMEATLMQTVGTTGAYTSLGSATYAVNPVEITFGDNGSVWVTSSSGSTDYPLTANALQSTNAGSHDVVISNLSADLSTLIYSTYFGGTGWDGGVAIEINPETSDVVVAGWTESPTLPASSAGWNTANLGGVDGFVTILTPALTNSATTFLGTANNDHAHRIAFDRYGNIYIAGRATAGNYPVTPGAYSVGGGAVFLQKMDAGLTQGLASTQLGSGNTTILPTAMIVDVCGSILLATITSSSAQTGMPLTADAFETAARPFWFCALTENFADLFFGSFFGTTGDHFHPATARMDKNGIIYHSVCATSTAYPATPNSFAPVKLNGSTNDNITFKFNFEATGVQSDFMLNPAIPQNDTGCVPYTISLTNLSTTYKEFIWDFGDGSPQSNDTNVTHTFTVPGTYTVTLYANNDSSCITSDTSYMTFVVMETNLPDIVVSDTTLCHYEQQINIGVTINNPSPYNSILWEPSAGILTAPDQAVISVDPSVNNVYNVTVKDTIPGICGFSVTESVHIDLSPRELDIITNDTVVCDGTIIPIVAVGTPGYTYRWTPSTGVSDTTALQPNILVHQSEIYFLTASYPDCADTTVSISIGMQEIPAVELGPNKTACQWSEIAIESAVSPYRNDYIYQWSPTSGLSITDGPNTEIVADSTITYRLDVRTPIGCAGFDTVRITVYPGGFGAIVSDTGYCPGNKAALWASGGVSYAWTPSYGLSDTTASNPVASPLTTTEYTVYIKDVHDCVDTEKVMVQVYPEAVLELPDSVSVYPGERYHIEPGTNASYFKWFPTSGLSDPNVADPFMSPQVRTRYFVEATTENGCVVVDSIDVLVPATVLDMPNAFNPGGNNRTFKASRRGIAELKNFSIFNRWGNKVFSTTNIDEGWDGTYNGSVQPMGVYIYIIEAVSESGQVFTHQGNVTLVR